MIGPSLKLQHYTVVINRDRNVQHSNLSLTAPKILPYLPCTEPKYVRSDTYEETTQWWRIQRIRSASKYYFLL